MYKKLRNGLCPESHKKMCKGLFSGGAEVVYLYNAAGGTNEASRLVPEITYDERGRINYASVTAYPYVSRELADELFKKWVAGEVRILVLSDTSLTNGGANKMIEVLSMYQEAADSSGDTWNVFATVASDTSVKRIKIA